MAARAIKLTRPSRLFDAPVEWSRQWQLIGRQPQRQSLHPARPLQGLPSPQLSNPVHQAFGSKAPDSNRSPSPREPVFTRDAIAPPGNEFRGPETAAPYGAGRPGRDRNLALARAFSDQTASES